MLRRLLLILAYVAAVAVIVLGTVVLVAYARGYSYDFKNHRFVLNGLVILDSAPGGANVSVNGKLIKHKTPYRATMEAGWYNFELTRPGFKTWTKQLQIIASEVTFAQFAILLPDDAKTDQIASTPPIVKSVGSHDHRQIAYISGGKDPGVWMMNLDGKQATRLYSPKAAAADQPAETLTDITWSDDNSHILIQTALAGKPNFYLVQASSNPSPIDLTGLFKFDFVSLKFNPSNWRELYWISPDGLRKLSIDQQTVSAVLADKVAAFAFAGDRVLFVQTTSLGRSLWSLDRNGQKQELIQSLAASDSYQLTYDKFRSRDFLAVITSSSSTLTVYSDIFSSTPVSKVITKSATEVLYSTDGRYFVYHDATTFGLYDLEKDTILQAPGLPGAISQISLFDNYHVLAVMNGSLYLAEYDGDNLSQLTDQAAVGSAAFPTADQKKVVELRTNNNPDTGDQLYTTEVKR